MIVWAWAARLIFVVLAASLAAQLWMSARRTTPPDVGPRIARSAAYGSGLAAGMKLRQNGADRMTCESQKTMSVSRFPADPTEQRDFRRGYRDGYDGRVPAKSS